MAKPRTLLIGGAAVGVCLYVVTNYNPFKTPATQAIGDRWSAAGGSDTHTPSVATPLGKSDMTVAKGGSRGVDSAQFKDKVADQRLDKSFAEKKFREAHYGQEKGK